MRREKVEVVAEGGSHGNGIDGEESGSGRLVKQIGEIDLKEDKGVRSQDEEEHRRKILEDIWKVPRRNE